MDRLTEIEARNEIAWAVNCLDSQYYIKELINGEYVGRIQRLDSIMSEDWWEGGIRNRVEAACNAAQDMQMKEEARRVIRGFDDRFPNSRFFWGKDA